VKREPGCVTYTLVSDNGIGYRPDADNAVGMTVRRLPARIGASLERSFDGGAKWEIRVPLSALQAEAPSADPTPG
jgi:two-component sensor histidine kinase